MILAVVLFIFGWIVAISSWIEYGCRLGGVIALECLVLVILILSTVKENGAI